MPYLGVPSLWWCYNCLQERLSTQAKKSPKWPISLTMVYICTFTVSHQCRRNLLFPLLICTLYPCVVRSLLHIQALKEHKRSCHASKSKQEDVAPSKDRAPTLNKLNPHWATNLVNSMFLVMTYRKNSSASVILQGELSRLTQEIMNTCSIGMCMWLLLKRS